MKKEIKNAVPAMLSCIAFLGLCILIISPAQPQPTNLVLNGDFEASGGSLQDWSGGADLYTAPSDGNHAAQLFSFASLEQALLAAPAPPASVTASLKFSAWPSEPGHVLQVNLGSEVDSVELSSTGFQSVSLFTEQGASIDSTSFLRFSVESYAGATMNPFIAIDDVVLTEWQQPTTPSPTPGDVETDTPSNTPTITPTGSATETPTQTPTETITGTPTHTPTETGTPKPTRTPTPTPYIASLKVWADPPVVYIPGQNDEEQIAYSLIKIQVGLSDNTTDFSGLMPEAYLDSGPGLLGQVQMDTDLYYALYQVTGEDDPGVAEIRVLFDQPFDSIAPNLEGNTQVTVHKRPGQVEDGAKVPPLERKILRRKEKIY